MSAPANPTRAAWQQVLLAERAANLGYDALGPDLDAGAHMSLARTCQQAHRALIVQTTAMLGALEQPSTPDPVNYQLPAPVTDDASAQSVAVMLEQACASAWRYLLAVLVGPSTSTATGPARALSVAALAQSAVRAVQWRRISAPDQASVPFPGI